jgi:hypothetical protein
VELAEAVAEVADLAAPQLAVELAVEVVDQVDL